jgi:hypothetical protein
MHELLLDSVYEVLLSFLKRSEARASIVHACNGSATQRELVNRNNYVMHTAVAYATLLNQLEVMPCVYYSEVCMRCYCEALML